MKFPIIVVTYAFIQISLCTQSDVPAEELVPTNPMISTSAYVLNSESVTELPLNNSASTSSEKADVEDSTQDSYDSSTSSNVRLATFSGITWNPVSSLVLSTDSLKKSAEYENTSPSSSSQYFMANSTNAFNYQTPPSIFENLDHEENELDSDTRETDISKSFKTTMKTDLPLIYTHKKLIDIETQSEGPHTSHSNMGNIFSENETISGAYTNLDTQLDVKNSSGITLTPISDHITAEIPFSVLNTNFTNPELSTESKETSSFLTTDKTFTSDSNLFTSSEHTSGHSDNYSMKEAENIKFITEDLKFSYDENSTTKSTTSLNIELDAENREHESNLYNSSLDSNSTYTASINNFESVVTLSISEKSNEGLELTSELDLESTPTSTFHPAVESDKILTPSTMAILNALDSNNLTSEIFPATSDILPLDISSNTRIMPPTTSTPFNEPFTQTSKDSNFLQEHNMSTTTDNTSLNSSYSSSIKSSDEENLSISRITSNSPSTTADESVTTTLDVIVSRNSHLITETEEYIGYKTASASISESTEMKETTLSSIDFTENHTSSNNNISSVERDRSNKHDASITLNSDKVTSDLSTTDKPAHLEVTITTYIPINDNASKLMTATDSSIMTEHHFPTTKTQLPTISTNYVEEFNSVTYLTTHKELDKESTTHFPTEEDTSTETIPYLWMTSNKTNTPITIPSDAVESKYSTAVFLSSHKDTNKETSIDVFTGKSTPVQTVSYHPFSSTFFEQSFSSPTINPISSLKPFHDLNTEEISVTEKHTDTDELSTLMPVSFSSFTDVITADSTDEPLETHREGKHIPFSTGSTVRVTDLSSEYGVLLVTSEKTPAMKSSVNDTEVQYMQIKIEDINLVDRNNLITAIIGFPVDSVYDSYMKIKLARTHQWLDKVLTKEFQNWTGDPFQNAEEKENEIPFGNISIFYVKPTPEMNASHITLTFIVYNNWKNRTLPVDFVPGTLNFYSKELKESINASTVYFYHGLATENYDLLSAVFDKYGIIIFTICLAIVGITILVCVVIFYRKKTRQSIHYLADSKLQQNLQEAVGIDLTPASIILQDEKEEKGNKICDDEGWLVPITDVPLAEDNNVPNVQDTKL